MRGCFISASEERSEHVCSLRPSEDEIYENHIYKKNFDNLFLYARNANRIVIVEYNKCKSEDSEAIITPAFILQF